MILDATTKIIVKNKFKKQKMAKINIDIKTLKTVSYCYYPDIVWYDSEFIKNTYKISGYSNC